MTFDITQIIAEHGNVYRDSGQAYKNLFKLLSYRGGFESLFKKKIITGTIDENAFFSSTSILQNFQTGFTPKGALTFKPLKNKVWHFKADTKIVPDDFQQSWLGFLAELKTERDQWKFTRWYIEKVMLPQMREDYILSEAFHGVYVAPITNTASAIGQASNGINKQINDFIVAGDTTPIVTGALNTTPTVFVKQIEDFVKQIDPRYKSKSMTLAMNTTLVERFMEGMDTLYNVNYSRYAEGQLPNVHLTNVKVGGFVEMTGSDKIFMSPAENMVDLIRKRPYEQSVQVDRDVRELKISTDYWRGLGFLIPQLIFTNDL